MKQRVNYTLIIFFVLTFLIFLLQNFQPFQFGSKILHKIFSPVLSRIYVWKIDMNESETSQIKELKDENRRLLKRQVEFEKLKKDNEALRSQFENSKFVPKNLLSASVIGFSGRTNNPTKLIIDKGKQNGVSEGLIVIYENNLVGVITQVTESSSHIMLPLHEGFLAAGKTLNDNAIGIITGEGDFIVIKDVPITNTLKKDDIVVTKGEDDNSDIKVYPDIIVGKISSINKNDNKPFQSASIVPVVDYSRITTVFIVMR